MSIEAMKQALYVMQDHLFAHESSSGIGICSVCACLSPFIGDLERHATGCEAGNAMTALRAAIEQAERAEPACWGWRYNSAGHAVVNRLVVTRTPERTTDTDNLFASGPFPLYEHPPAPQKPLTDEQINACWHDGVVPWSANSTQEVSFTIRRRVAFARAIEAAHGIKGES